MRRIRIVIADRYPIVLRGISSVLAMQHDFTIVASCDDAASCIEAVRLLAPDIVLVDVAMPDLDHSEILAVANAAGFGIMVVFFTGAADDWNLQGLAADGAYIVLTKDAKPEMLLEVLRQAAQGQGLASPPLSNEQVGAAPRAGEEKSLAQLTDRERQIMRLVSEGLTNKEIGRRLNITDGTIKVHLHHIFQKLDISNRTVLAALAISRNELRAARREPVPREPDPSARLQRDPASAK